MAEGSDAGGELAQQISEGGEGSCEKLAFLFCAVAPDCHGGGGSPGCTEGTDGGARAVVAKAKLWDTKVLKVFFFNPEVAEKEWNVTIDKIIEWANEWRKKKPEKAHEIPEFKRTMRGDKADIRVELSEKKGCWSMVGTNAREVRKESDPTMVLNLGPKSGCKKEKCQKSLVIHEFGHALGMEHEHQRSDFWKAAEKHLDVKKMKDDKRVTTEGSGEGEASYGHDWFERHFSTSSEDVDTTDYDPDSIMHYGFDKDWIKNREYRDVRKVMQAKELPKEEKACLMGIIKRHYSLAEGPSDKDIEALEKAYEKSS